jgi:lysophospholipase L1-like esterase
VVFCDTRGAVAAPGQPDRLVSSPDDLHPSPEGYKRMASALEPAITQPLARPK